jgi:D-amino peptidase
VQGQEENDMRYFILTDLEGVAGNHSFAQTRTKDLAAKEPGMRQLAKEVNACIEGIRSVDADADIDVWDGHGSGGIFPGDIVGANLLPHTVKQFKKIPEYQALLFVGQHAMAGTPYAPLRHTYSSLHVAYYKLNGSYIGEFGGRAITAAHYKVRTIFIAGDDKAAHEAQILIPEIETAVVKWGKGEEDAVSLSSEEACAVIREGAARAVRRMDQIPLLQGFEPPFRLEIRYYEPMDRERRQKPGVTIIDDRTLVIETDDLLSLPL